MNPTINQLKTFQRVVQLGSIHAAARDLNLSQPSISQRIRELETCLGASLFDRVGQTLRLTTEGHALVDYAERVLDATSELVDRFASHDPLRGTLRLGVSESFALVCLPELLRRLEQRYPGIRASVLVGDLAVRQKLESQGLDIAIAYEPAVGPRVKQETLGRCEFVWIASGSYPLGPKALTLEELGKHHLIVPPAPSPLHDAIRKWFSGFHVGPARMSTCSSVAAIVATVLHGTALGFMPRRVVDEQLANRSLRIVRTNPGFPSQPVSICYHASEFGESVKAFVGLTREVSAQYRLFQ